jgi:hypothetical protein
MDEGIYRPGVMTTTELDTARTALLQALDEPGLTPTTRPKCERELQGIEQEQARRREADARSRTMAQADHAARLAAIDVMGDAS